MIPQVFQTFGASCGGSFFGLPTWYTYLVKAGDISGSACQITKFKVPDDFILIGFGLLDILLQLAGMIAVGFIIYGGILYLTSEGSSDKTKQAQGTIINALAGLVIAIVAATAVAFIGTAVSK